MPLPEESTTFQLIFHEGTWCLLTLKRSSTNRLLYLKRFIEQEPGPRAFNRRNAFHAPISIDDTFHLLPRSNCAEHNCHCYRKVKISFFKTRNNTTRRSEDTKCVSPEKREEKLGIVKSPKYLDAFENSILWLGPLCGAEMKCSRPFAVLETTRIVRINEGLCKGDGKKILCCSWASFEIRCRFQVCGFAVAQIR